MPPHTHAALRQGVSLRFTAERQFNEFGAVLPRLRALLWEVAHYSLTHCGITPIITHVLRTQEEQEAIYGKNTKRRSPHQDGRAADLRSRIYTAPQITDLVKYINTEFPRHDGYPTALYHTVGLGWHLHLQVAPTPKGD